MSFTIGNLVQDVVVKPEHIQTSTDSLRAFFSVLLDFRFREPRDPKNASSIDFFNIQANLLLSHGNVLLSTTTCPCSINLFNKEVERSEWLRFTLDDAAIFTIQKFRNGQDINLKIEYKLTALIKDAFDLIEKSTIWSSEYVRYYNGETQFTIPKSTWVEKLLQGLGYPGFRLIEIPLKHNLITEAYQDIIEEFNLAQAYYAKADHNKCVQHCRGTLDKLNESLKEIKKGINSNSKFQWLKKIDEATLSWIDSMDRSTYAITSGPHHSGLKKEFTRKEAESIYLVTLGIMNFVGHASVDFN